MAWGRREHGALLYSRARVTEGDDGGESAVLGRLGRRTYGWRRGGTGVSPRAGRTYGDAARGVLGRGECREVWASGGARPRAVEAS
jgi:hypothetical protein